MVSSSATSVEAYLAEFEEPVRSQLAAIRQLCLDHLPPGLEEAMNWGMIVYQVPLSTLPDTYNDQPLAYAALAKQKHHFSLYLMSIYADENLRQEFEDNFAKAGKKLNAGKSCVRFKKLDELHIPAIQKALGAVSVDEYVASYQKSRQTK